VRGEGGVEAGDRGEAQVAGGRLRGHRQSRAGEGQGPGNVRAGDRKVDPEHRRQVNYFSIFVHVLIITLF